MSKVMSVYPQAVPQDLREMLVRIEDHPCRTTLQTADGPCGIIRMIQRSVAAGDWNNARPRAQKALYQLDNLQAGIPPDLWNIQSRIDNHPMLPILQNAECFTGVLKMLQHSIYTGDWNLALEQASRVLTQLENLAAGPPPDLRELIWRVESHPLRALLQSAEMPGGVARLLHHAASVGDWDGAQAWALRALKALEQLENLARGPPDDLRGLFALAEAHPRRATPSDAAAAALGYARNGAAVADWAAAREWTRCALEHLDYHGTAAAAATTGTASAGAGGGLRSLQDLVLAHPHWPALLRRADGQALAQAVDRSIAACDWAAARTGLQDALARLGRMQAAAPAPAAPPPDSAAAAAVEAAAAAAAAAGSVFGEGWGGGLAAGGASGDGEELGGGEEGDEDDEVGEEDLVRLEAAYAAGVCGDDGAAATTTTTAAAVSDADAADAAAREGHAGAEGAAAGGAA
jgi:hypothetical protein